MNPTVDSSDDDFVRAHERFVRGIVKQACAQLALDCDVEDLVGYGFAGLLEARKRFDATKGVPFKSFAHYRVRGAIIDGVRKMAYLPRRAYARLRAAEVADRAAEGLAEQRAASRSVVADVPASLRAMDSVIGQAAAAFCASLADGEPEGIGASPEEVALAKQRRKLIAEALTELPEREQMLVRGHDLEGRRLDELAAEAGLSKSWASRLHAKALERLRSRLREY
ncbi:MAG: sigma-70 family RNA polymerase sigma factor [Myxococcales bacterium]|nr:sigma-70 family RNA polymerase sigma factor [Myxococcales bacterium]MDD9972326.1 sigma-70 family RNA polymerase sigma factor [Myxococcales bacterium]